ncbi:MAG: preprotein translocase subunit SecA [Bacteroides sp.]|nr:preprotein translocase subunit SecA [Bacillota bacterium]MCM1393538.1 preprotein translocase subunit SecA [[Eubacterium] siraeum]MCM1455342.1 preprotein translocase subunit SecA [Bacteroides sp.]
MSIFNENDRRVKKLMKIADKIEAMSAEYKAMSDEELISQTSKLKARLQAGETLDDVLPAAYATVREAGERVLGMRHFYVQLLGGIALHQGRIAEMATGEGKTLVATLPAYLNALTGKGVHVVTVNDYLATRDANWMGKLYKFLGLSVGVVVPGLNPEKKREAYNSDITYCTNNELGFDFLRDNMVVEKAQKVQRELNFAIIDEVDSILIDEARTPLIISGRGGKSSELYRSADNFARQCKEGADFTIEEKEKTIMLTDDGVAKAERFFHVTNLTDLENTELYHHIQQALKAHFMMRLNKDYIVSDGEVLIVDEFTGRIMVGRRYNEGLHQAIEAKEHVVIRSENKTLATITFQNFFRMYTKLSGMTGTAKTEEEEFQGIYSLDVVTIPPNKQSQRKDEHDKIYTKVGGKLTAIVQDIIDSHAKGQPVLVGTISVEKSEELSDILKCKGILHKVLNAKFHKEESEIIAQAGKFGAVTIATNMAGRGTDIMLGGNPDFQAKQKMEKDGYPIEIIELASSPMPSDDEEIIKAKEVYKHHYDAFKEICDEDKKKVIEVGGLRIIGTERHESRRIDNQLRGRAGRQGDPGSTVFYISMEDDVARIFGGDKMKSIADALRFDDSIPISNPLITKSIERSQRMVEGRNYSIRKQVLSYDDVMNQQREIIYKERGKVLDGMDVHDQIVDMIGDLAEEIIGYYADYKTDYNTWDYEAFNGALEKRMLPEGTNVMNPDLCSCFDVYKLKDAVLKIAIPEYNKKVETLTADGFDFSNFERVVLLKTVDAKWIDHIDAMDALRRGIGLRGYGQRDPVISYRQEGWDMFEDMVNRIHTETASILLKVQVEKREGEDAKLSQKIASAKKTVVGGGKVGRNDPCPCGSGKKYKNCCGRNL